MCEFHPKYNNFLILLYIFIGENFLGGCILLRWIGHHD